MTATVKRNREKFVLMKLMGMAMRAQATGTRVRTVEP